MIRNQRSSEGPSGGSSSIIRTLAILLMVSGVIGFFVGRLAYPENILCLFGSTLLTFGGLGLLLHIRRTASGAPTQSNWNTRQVESPPDSYQQWEAIEPEQEEPYGQILLDQVITAFEEQGAQVTTETRRAERSILNVTMPEGQRVTVIVNDSAEPVDAPEIRALHALVLNNGSQEGFYITAGSFTSRAEAWATGRPLQLIDQGQVGLISG